MFNPILCHVLGVCFNKEFSSYPNPTFVRPCLCFNLDDMCRIQLDFLFLFHACTAFFDVTWFRGLRWHHSVLNVTHGAHFFANFSMGYWRTFVKDTPVIRKLLSRLIWDNTWRSFYQWFPPTNQKLMEIFPCYISSRGHQIASKFCTCHDSYAVVACAKFCSDHLIGI